MVKSELGIAMVMILIHQKTRVWHNAQHQDMDIELPAGQPLVQHVVVAAIVTATILIHILPTQAGVVEVVVVIEAAEVQEVQSRDGRVQRRACIIHKPKFAHSLRFEKI